MQRFHERMREDIPKIDLLISIQNDSSLTFLLFHDMMKQKNILGGFTWLQKKQVLM